MRVKISLLAARSAAGVGCVMVASILASPPRPRHSRHECPVMNAPATVLRTPDERFAALPDYGFAPHYLPLQDARFGPLRMHYVDEGPREAPVVLMLHGEPTWSFLYRKMIPPIARAGYRAVAPDLIGFGR